MKATDRMRRKSLKKSSLPVSQAVRWQGRLMVLPATLAWDDWLWLPSSHRDRITHPAPSLSLLSHRAAFANERLEAVFIGEIFLHTATKPRQHFSSLISVLWLLRKQVRMSKGTTAGRRGTCMCQNQETPVLRNGSSAEGPKEGGGPQRVQEVSSQQVCFVWDEQCGWVFFFFKHVYTTQQFRDLTKTPLSGFSWKLSSGGQEGDNQEVK